MAVFSVYAGDPFSYEMDDRPFYDAVSTVVSDVSSDIFVTAANLRQRSQQKSFDFGYWNMKYIMPDVVERTDRYFCPSEASGCWIPGVIVGTASMMAGWSPLFATTLLAYTNPYTAGPAAALDAYNIYRYFDD